ncbi:hypothetical protein BC827DRAFT_1125468 [Russula dissimulans]|nr:hypothetical protein BC827DRAFT_1125468 [Russula dissimulans]
MSRYLRAILVVIFAFFYIVFASYLPSEQNVPTAAERKYAKAHSLGSGYSFDSKDGWQTVNVSNLPYKYRPRSTDIHGITKATVHHTYVKTIADQFNSVVMKVWNGIAFSVTKEKPTPVITTWYTGKDLLNPSCWSNPVWAPTDHSYVCAITQEGWVSKPKCFDFLELCTRPERCVFTRVVDSCAGCAKGSKHVDLTRAAFGSLADPDEGILTVFMRHAKEPSEW